ncbi:hypothetical protein LCGC14_0384230 [marine sediment metagenome]|uniref:Uncharacterized protein n=1 Tax=marine sediment metagenome TaxID=412755 RepID=A0A0F9T753_9ZZZZ
MVGLRSSNNCRYRRFLEEESEPTSDNIIYVNFLTETALPDSAITSNERGLRMAESKTRIGRKTWLKHLGVSKEVFYDLVADGMPVELRGKDHKRWVGNVDQVDEWSRARPSLGPGCRSRVGSGSLVKSETAI